MKRILLLSLPLILLLSLSAFAQDAQQNLTLVVAGQPGQAPIVQINGKSYVDINALARLTHSSVSIKGNRIILTPLGSAPSAPPANPEPSASAGQLKLVAERQPVDPEPSEAAGQTKPAAAEPAPAEAESEAARTAALAKAAQNPVADMISFPLQNNTNFGVGPNQRVQDVLNFQPVIPLHLNAKWNLITRTILPVVWQPNSPQPNGQGWYGIGDLNPSLFFSPAKSGKLIWGVGPAIVLPTATAPELGQGKVSAGPGVVALTTPGHWVIGALANNVWSFAGTGSRPPVNQFLLQYFVNYNMKGGWYVTTAPIITADWRASSGNQLTLPFGGGFGRIMKIGFQPVNMQLQFFGNAKYPTGSSPWGMRFQIAFLYPKFSKAQEEEMLKMKLEQLEKEQQQAAPKK
ncbi:MAG TPA: neuromedin U [Terriglobales bacterium]